MKRSRFTEEQIIGILRKQEAGVATANVCRKHGISGATFYKWKVKFGGMNVSEARRLTILEDESAKLMRDALLNEVLFPSLARALRSVRALRPWPLPQPPRWAQITARLY